MSRSIQVLRTVQQVRQWRRQCLLNRQTVGFVPTMGALHAGHCHLVDHSIRDNDKTVVSIFVNPSQFAPHEDLDAYPRTLDRDLAMLERQFPAAGKSVDAVFVPKISEIYPSGIVLDVQNQTGAFVTVQGLSEQLEGASRPAFFRGVATVVTKLLNVVTPEKVYFGQKDAQQCVVIKNLVKDLLMDTKVEILDTFREPNGLAMSSRNEYLSAETKDQCGIIFQGLTAAKTRFLEACEQGKPLSASDIRETVQGTYKAMPQEWEIDYIAVSHPDTLADLAEIDTKVGALVSVAVRVPKDDGTVARLIDNVQLK